MTKEGTFAAFEITDDAPKKKGKLPPRLEAQRKAKERKPEMKATDVEAKISEAGKRREVSDLRTRISLLTLYPPRPALPLRVCLSTSAVVAVGTGVLS